MSRVELAHFEIISEDGLHMRPASKIVKIIQDFSCHSVFVVHEGGERQIRGLLDIVSLGMICGHRLTLRIQGKEPESVLSQFRNLTEHLRPL